MQWQKAFSKADEASLGRIHQVMPVCSSGRLIPSLGSDGCILSKRRYNFGVRLLERQLRRLANKYVLVSGMQDVYQWPGWHSLTQFPQGQGGHFAHHPRGVG